MVWSLITSVLTHVFDAVPSFGSALLLLLAARVVFVRTTRFEPEGEIAQHRNAAAGVVFGGYLFAVALAVAGTLFGARTDPPFVRMAEIMGEGLLIIALLRLSLSVNDRFILSRFCAVKEVKEDDRSA